MLDGKRDVMEKITVFIKAYNPGKLIYRCVDSVINQTWKDFVFIIIDNASSDGTKEVLEEYAKKDDRIRLYRNEDNSVSSIDVMKNMIDTDYFMMLDHDDWLELDALENLYRCAEDTGAEMVFGRTKMWGIKGQELGVWGYDTCVVIRNEEIPQHFARLYWQLRTVWGILIHRNQVEHLDDAMIADMRKGRYAVDTTMTMNMVFASKQIAVIPEVIHNYLVHEGSESGLYRRHQFYANWRIFEIAYQYLHFYGEVSPENEFFLYRVFGTAICDTIENDLRAKINEEDFIIICMEILEHERTRKWLAETSRMMPEERKRFFDVFGRNIFSSYIVSQQKEQYQKLLKIWLQVVYKEVPFTENDMECLLNDQIYLLQFLCNGDIEKMQQTMWKETVRDVFSVEMLHFFVEKVKQTPKEFSEKLRYLLARNEQIKETILRYVYGLAEQNLLLKQYDVEFLTEYAEIVLSVCAEAYIEALDGCMKRIDEEEKKNLNLLELALNLAAVTEHAGLFVFIRKMQFVECYNAGFSDVAMGILADLEEMCPEDEDVVVWKTEITTEKQ